MLRLVRPPLNALALDLGLVFSEICIPLTIRCLHAIVVLGGACSLARLHQLLLWCGRHWCTGGNEARSVLGDR